MCCRGSQTLACIRIIQKACSEGRFGSSTRTSDSVTGVKNLHFCQVYDAVDVSGLVIALCVGRC